MPKVTWERAVKAQSTLAQLLQYNDEVVKVGISGTGESGYHLVVLSTRPVHRIPFDVDGIAVVNDVAPELENDNGDD